MGKSEYKKLADAKKAAKDELFKKSYPGTAADTPLLMVMAPSSSKEREVFMELMNGVIVLPMKVIVVDDESPEDAVKRPKGHITWVSREDGRNPAMDSYLDAADMVLTFDEDHEEVKDYMEKGAVVIGHEKSPLLENYHPNEETGNSFTFASNSPWEIFRALVRAYETYRFPFDWGNIVRGTVK